MTLLVDQAYRVRYETLFAEELSRAPSGAFDESALPSYTHPNRLMSWLFWRRLEVAFRMFPSGNGAATLDFGCGGGVAFEFLRRRNCRITGCDNEAAGLATRVATALKLDAEIVEDVSILTGRRFDVVLALDVLEHVDNLAEVLEHFRNLLPVGGVLIVSGPTENWVYKMGRWMAGFSGHYHVSNIYDVEASLGAAGFQRKQLRRLYPLVELFRVSAWSAPGSRR